MIRQEIGQLLEPGVSPELALVAGRWAARRFLGLPGIEEGAIAGLVAYSNNPLEDLEALANPALVILDGTEIASASGRGWQSQASGRELEVVPEQPCDASG